MSPLLVGGERVLHMETKEKLLIQDILLNWEWPHVILPLSRSWDSSNDSTWDGRREEQGPEMGGDEDGLTASRGGARRKLWKRSLLTKETKVYLEFWKNYKFRENKSIFGNLMGCVNQFCGCTNLVGAFIKLVGANICSWNNYCR